MHRACLDGSPAYIRTIAVDPLCLLFLSMGALNKLKYFVRAANSNRAVVVFIHNVPVRFINQWW